MNERLMQFRIGMFVIVAGLVLTMMIVWFGESPSLLRDQVYVTVRFAEAPGVLEGVPVRKSGIRIGEVVSIAFEERKDHPDSVLVTLALDRRYRLRENSTPRLTRSLIGDVAIDMLPGTGDKDIPLSMTPGNAPIIEGEVAPDPSKALAAATKAFESAGDTLTSIKAAGEGLVRVTKSADNLDRLLTQWNGTGQDVSGAAQAIRRFIDANEGDFQPAIANLRQVAAKLDKTLDEETQESLKVGIRRFSEAVARIDAGVADLMPALKDVGSDLKHMPTTDVGTTLRRLTLITQDLELLTRRLRDSKGRLNTEGTLQKLIIKSELHDNLNQMALSANAALLQLRSVLAALRTFADKVSSDPGSITRGALRQ